MNSSATGVGSAAVARRRRRCPASAGAVWAGVVVTAGDSLLGGEPFGQSVLDVLRDLGRVLVPEEQLLDAGADEVGAGRVAVAEVHQVQVGRRVLLVQVPHLLHERVLEADAGDRGELLELVGHHVPELLGGEPLDERLGLLLVLAGRAQAPVAVRVGRGDRVVQRGAGRRRDLEDPELHVRVLRLEEGQLEGAAGEHRRLLGGEQDLGLGVADADDVLGHVVLHVHDGLQRVDVGLVGEVRLAAEDGLFELGTAVLGRAEDVVDDRHHPGVQTTDRHRGDPGLDEGVVQLDELLPCRRLLQAVLLEDPDVVVHLQGLGGEGHAVHLAVLPAQGAGEDGLVELADLGDDVVERDEVAALDERLEEAVAAHLGDVRPVTAGEARLQDLVVLGVDEGLEVDRAARVGLLEGGEDDVVVDVGVLGAPGPHPQGHVLGALLALPAGLGLLAGVVVGRVRRVLRRRAGGEQEDGGQRCRGEYAALHHGSLRDGVLAVWDDRDSTAARTTPPVASRAVRAWAAVAPDRLITSATLRSPPASSRSGSQSARSRPVAWWRIVTVRARSFWLVATIETMRLDHVRPRRTMSAVEKLWRTSFWAVADFIRVEPVSASGPVSATTATSTPSSSRERGLEVTSAVKAPWRAAWARAPATYGVRPEAARPMTTSYAPTGPKIGRA